MRKPIIALALLAVAASVAYADPARFHIEIKESAVNKLAAEFELPHWDGQLLLVPGTPISPETKLLWKSSVKSVSYDLTDTGIDMGGQIETRYALQVGDEAPADSAYSAFTQNFESTATVYFTSNGKIRFKVADTVNLPIAVPVPGFGDVTVFTLQTSFPGFQLDYPVPSPFHIDATDKRRTVRGRVFDMTREYGNGKLTLHGSVRFW